MNAQFPPDFVLDLHYLVDPYQVEHEARPPLPVMKAFMVNDIGRWNEQVPAEAAKTSEPDHRESGLRTYTGAAERPPASRLIDAVVHDRADQVTRWLNGGATRGDIDAEDDTGRSALDHALEQRKFPVARLLVRHGARVADDMAFDAVLLNDLIVAGEMPLARELANLRLKLLQTAGNAFPDEVQRWQVPLFQAIRSGDLELLRLLVTPAMLAVRDRMGGNALHFATNSPNEQLLAILLSLLPTDAAQRQRILDAPRVDGYTPLIQAVIANRPTAVAVLLRAGAAVDAVDVNGDSALHKAARVGQLDILRLLLAGGARTDLSNDGGHTATEVAHRHGRPEILQLMQAFCMQD